MKYILCDINQELCDAWKVAFDGVEDVTVVHGSIFDLAVDAIVSPANSFGFMDGGLDYLISEKLGWDIQDRLKDIIKHYYDGELLVGQATIVKTNNKSIPYVISAPTMRVPMILGTNSVNVFLATKAVFNIANQHEKNFFHTTINTIAIPGMGTGVGQVPFELCAWQMRKAYNYVKSKSFPATWKDAQTSHQLLTVAPPQVRDLQKP